MNLNQKYPIAEYNTSSSIFFDLQESLINNNIDFEIQYRTDYDEGISFDTAIFYVNPKDLESAKKINRDILKNSKDTPVYWKYIRKFIFLFILASIVLLILFLLKI